MSRSLWNKGDWCVGKLEMQFTPSSVRELCPASDIGCIILMFFFFFFGDHAPGEFESYINQPGLHFFFFNYYY